LELGGWVLCLRRWRVETNPGQVSLRPKVNQLQVQIKVT